MADENQVGILRRDVSQWNACRADNPTAKIDLSYADRRSARMENADLRGADLTGADMILSVLTMADLRGAHLQSAQLSFAYTGGAKLPGADRSGALLYATTFLRNDVQDAVFSNANVFGVNVWDSVERPRPKRI
jgi:uncharacterized protein YjbI with pentapeptide repeats